MKVYPFKVTGVKIEDGDDGKSGGRKVQCVVKGEEILCNSEDTYHNEDAPNVTWLPDKAEIMKKNHQKEVAMGVMWQA